MNRLPLGDHAPFSQWPRWARLCAAAALLLSLLSPVLGGVAGCRPDGERPTPAPAPAPAPAPSGQESAKRGGSGGDSVEVPPEFAFPPGTTEIPQLLSPEELREGWIALFDGRTLFGWEAANEANWRVEEGAIVVDKGEVGLLCTTSRFANYRLRLEYAAAPDVNSGIFLRTPLRPTDPAADCYELNIAPPDNPFPTGSLVKRQKVAATPDTESAEPPADPGGLAWHAYEVTVDGPRVTVVLDGKQVLEYTDPQPLTAGRIGLQLNSGQVRFRKLRLQLLGLEPLFNGRDLDGWKTYPQMASEFAVTPAGELRVTNGKGQLESRNAYADFALQLDARSNAPGLNSGIFFRCIPGEEMNGYESQIDHGYQPGDRTKPLDFGSGGIFRRRKARLVVGNDNQWFTKTLVADGPHIAVWIDGVQVTDWTDSRPPDPNPRKGLRLEAGTLMIQGHDPTTDFSFRNLRLAPLPAASESPSP